MKGKKGLRRRRYWITLRKGEGTGTWMRKH